LIGRSRGDNLFGVEVRVSGRFVPGLVSAAQQGRPFEVETIEPV
jgi:hypothetical protein